MTITGQLDLADSPAWPYPGVATVHALVSALGLDGQPVTQQASAVRQVMETPAWDAAPPVLQRDVRRWLDLLYFAPAEFSITGQAIGLTGDGHGHHVAGTPMVYKHGFIPIDGTEVGEDGVRRPGGHKAAAKPGSAVKGTASAQRRASAPQAAKTAPAALRGDAAYDHVTEPVGKKERDAADYYSVGSGRLNPPLRSGGKLTDKTDKAQLRNLESAFDKAPPTTQHIVAYRGTTGALFGKGDAAGTQFVDHGFTSVSTDQRQAGMFGSESDPALMEIHVPAGSKVVKPGAAGHYSEGGEAEKELVLNHGGRYEITGDQVVNDPVLGKIRKLTATYRGPA
jgi:hypothetical protein